MRCVSPHPVLTQTFENHSFERSQHLQEQQQRDRSRFFYHLRQKRKQRRLQNGPFPIHHHQQQPQQQLHVQQLRENSRQEQKHQVLSQYIHDSLQRGNKLVTAIVGSSIARNISVKNIENESNEVRLRFKSGGDCADALSWLQTSEGQIFMDNVNQLIFIIGTNDIHRVGADDTIQRIAYTVKSVRQLYPGVNIIWQMLQRRTLKTWLLPEGQPVLNEISRCNIQLTQLAIHMKFSTIQPDIPIEFMYDGLHPSVHGVNMMETTLRNYLKQNKMFYSGSFSHISSLFRTVALHPPLMSINL